MLEIISRVRWATGSVRTGQGSSKGAAYAVAYGGGRKSKESERKRNLHQNGLSSSSINSFASIGRDQNVVVWSA